MLSFNENKLCFKKKAPKKTWLRFQTYTIFKLKKKNSPHNLLQILNYFQTIALFIVGDWCLCGLFSCWITITSDRENSKLWFSNNSLGWELFCQFELMWSSSLYFFFSRLYVCVLFKFVNNQRIIIRVILGFTT